MIITRNVVAEKLIDFLQHRLSLADMVNWAEAAIMEEEFDEHNYHTLRDIVSRLGLADVKAFGLSWTDCEDFLSRLGYRISVLVSDQSAVAA